MQTPGVSFKRTVRVAVHLVSVPGINLFSEFWSCLSVFITVIVSIVPDRHAGVGSTSRFSKKNVMVKSRMIIIMCWDFG